MGERPHPSATADGMPQGRRISAVRFQARLFQPQRPNVGSGSASQCSAPAGSEVREPAWAMTDEPPCERRFAIRLSGGGLA